MSSTQTTDLVFKEMLSSIIAPELRARGFSRRAQTFYLLQEHNVGLINFQRSIESNAGVIVFTVNLGVISLRLIKFFNRTTCAVSKLEVNDCHWRDRLGFLLPERCDKWWEVYGEASAKQVGSEVLGELVGSGIPELSKYMSDEALRDLWLTGRSPGLTDLSRLMNLSVLVNEIGPSTALESVLVEFRRKAENAVSPFIVERHLQRLSERSKG